MFLPCLHHNHFNQYINANSVTAFFRGKLTQLVDAAVDYCKTPAFCITSKDPVTIDAESNHKYNLLYHLPAGQTADAAVSVSQGSDLTVPSFSDSAVYHSRRG